MQSQGSPAGSSDTRPVEISLTAGPSFTRTAPPLSATSSTVPERTVLHRLTEIQSAELGRKYVSCDRRPLDPPPVVALQVIDVYDEGLSTQRKVPRIPTEAMTVGIVCFAELFCASPSQGMVHGQQQDSIIGIEAAASEQTNSGSSSGLVASYGAQRSADFAASFNPFQDSLGVSQIPSSSMPWASTNSNFSLSVPTPQMEVASRSRSKSAAASSNQASTAGLLVGSTATEPLAVEWKGQTQILFPFGDLAVRAEGAFYLRYRVFDVTQVSDTRAGGMITECVGRPFRVYGTHDFPGMGASTELTLRLSMYGARVNTRATEGRGKRYKEAADNPREAIPTASGSKRKSGS